MPAAQPADRAPVALVLLVLAGFVAAIIAAGVGSMSVAPSAVLAILVEPLGLDLPFAFTETESAVVWGIRLPRVALALVLGASLAVSGALTQGIFRNPLAEPGLIGIASGAALAAAAVIVLGGGGGLLPFAAFTGAAVTSWLVYRVSMVDGRTSVVTMLLAGVAINALGFAGLGVLQSIADDNALRGLTFWMLGSLGGATWSGLAVVVPLLLVPLVAARWLARPLNALLLGESEAGHLGVRVDRVQASVVAIVALGVGAGVALTGMIAFVGLVVPHLVRLAFSPDHRTLLPASAALGALLLVVADLFARTVVQPAEMPIGVVTTLAGAPVFLWLLMRARRSLL